VIELTIQMVGLFQKLRERQERKRHYIIDKFLHENIDEMIIVQEEWAEGPHTTVLIKRTSGDYERIDTWRRKSDGLPECRNSLISAQEYDGKVKDFELSEYDGKVKDFELSEALVRFNKFYGRRWDFKIRGYSGQGYEERSA